MSENIGLILPHTQTISTGRVRVERVLPAPGEILVQMGERVEATQKIARTPMRGEIQVLNVARILGLDNRDLARVMVKKRGDRVEAGEILATRQGVLPFLHKPCRSPSPGRLVAIAHGWVVIEAESDGQEGPAGEAERVDLLAFVAGQVTDIIDRRSVTIETVGTHILGACGLGSEGHGVLQVAVEDRTDILTADDIGMGSNNAILVGGAGVSPEALNRATEMKVKGIIVGGMSSSFRELTSAPSFPIVATEGYGSLPMAPVEFEILKQLEGHEASISGRMGEARDASRPEIIIPITEHQGVDDGKSKNEDISIQPPQIGHQVRALRHPLLGQMGEITSIPAAAQPLPSGLSLPGAQVDFVSFLSTEEPFSQHDMVSAQGVGSSRPSSTQFVPWLNLERIV
jgi:hypothetical protein